MLRKKNKQEFLYAGFKERMQTENEVVAKGDKKVDKRVQIKKKFIVSVTSLKHGCGSSYMSAAIANYLSKKVKEKVCLLHTGFGYASDVLNDKVELVFYPCDLSVVFADYGYIVYDGGILNELDKDMLDRSDIKILMCWHNEEFKHLLLDFVKSRKDLNNWAFGFNHVPDKLYKDVYSLMEGLCVFCLPTFDVEHIDKTTEKIFSELFFNN